MAYICTNCKKPISEEDTPRIIELNIDIKTHDLQDAARGFASVCSLKCLKAEIEKETKEALARFTSYYEDGA